MRNITFSIEEEDLKKARIKALQEDTSLEDVIRDFMKQYINRNTRYLQLTGRLLKHTEHLNEFEGGRNWIREDLYYRIPKL